MPLDTAATTAALLNQSAIRLEIASSDDSLLEGAGFEPPVPLL
jgi:hypothetical protein